MARCNSVHRGTPAALRRHGGAAGWHRCWPIWRVGSTRCRRPLEGHSLRRDATRCLRHEQLAAAAAQQSSSWGLRNMRREVPSPFSSSAPFAPHAAAISPTETWRISLKCCCWKMVGDRTKATCFVIDAELSHASSQSLVRPTQLAIPHAPKHP